MAGNKGTPSKQAAQSSRFSSQKNASKWPASRAQAAKRVNARDKGGEKIKSGKSSTPPKIPVPVSFSRRKHPSHKSRPFLTAISPERKIDLVGILITLLGVLTFLSLISINRSGLTGWWINGLGRLFGWGVYALPIAFLVIGLWMVFRNMERLPMITIERLVGILLLLINLLAWTHFLIGGNLTQAGEGQGGGYIGALILQGLTSALGPAGSAVVLIAWLLIALAFTFDVTIPEIFHWIAPVKDFLTGLWKSYRANRNQSSSQEAVSLPPNFTPMPGALAQPESTALPTGVNTSSPQTVSPASASEAFLSSSGSGPAQAAPSWVLPQIDAILDAGIPPEVDHEQEQQRGHLIEETLASFGAPAHIVEIHRGPTITQYGVEPDFVETRNGHTRVRVSKIVSLADDLALALAAPRIRIQAPVPGRAYVGIEVPNNQISRVALRDVIESESFQKLHSPLRFALGKDVAGNPVAADLAAMPHLLIAGTTGSGKSVCVNAILSCLLMNNTPDYLRLILVDPKRVELTGYNGVPHLLAPVVTDAEKVVSALQWMMREMDSRYQKFAQAGARNIVDYNNRLQSRNEKPIPYLIIVIDELADLMMMAPEETERTITRLAQLARATGLHLILATQRPSVDVLTGLIKANFPARIAFAVASGVDSRVILDQPGAERLLGRGDMLFQAPDAPAPIRLQGAHVSESEIQRLVEYWKLFSIPQTPAPPGAESSDRTTDGLSKDQAAFKQAAFWGDMTPPDDGDPIYKDAVELVRREGRASISMLQRRMRIGYTRAARLIDTMEEKGIVGPPQANTQVREVLDYGQTAPPHQD